MPNNKSNNITIIVHHDESGRYAFYEDEIKKFVDVHTYAPKKPSHRVKSEPPTSPTSPFTYISKLR